jgi:hypothetical protein
MTIPMFFANTAAIFAIGIAVGSAIGIVVGLVIAGVVQK